MTKVTPVATGSESTHKELETKAKEAAGQVTDQMNTLYIGAFLDPGNWLDGSYDSVWELFDKGASTEAQSQVETLTAGTSAGDTFEQILPDDRQAEGQGAVRPQGSGRTRWSRSPGSRPWGAARTARTTFG